MSDLVINFDINNDYVVKMLDLINKFLDELDKMGSYPNNLNWKSHNKDLIIDTYNKEINDYRIFAENLYKIIKKIEEFNDEYQECTFEIKEKLAYIEAKYGFGDEDE